jgi:hypothetical protein
LRFLVNEDTRFSSVSPLFSDWTWVWWISNKLLDLESFQGSVIFQMMLVERLSSFCEELFGMWSSDIIALSTWLELQNWEIGADLQGWTRWALSWLCTAPCSYEVHIAYLPLLYCKILGFKEYLWVLFTVQFCEILNVGNINLFLVVVNSGNEVAASVLYVERIVCLKWDIKYMLYLCWIPNAVNSQHSYLYCEAIISYKFASIRYLQPCD